MHESDDNEAADEIIEAPAWSCRSRQARDGDFLSCRAEQAETEESDLLDEAEVEHTTVRELIEKIEDMGAGADRAHVHTSRCWRST